RVRTDLAALQPGDLLKLGGEVVGVGHGLKVEPAELLWRIAEDFVQPPIGAQPGTVEGDLSNANRGPLKDSAEQLIAVAQGGFPGPRLQIRNLRPERLDLG